MQLLLLHMHAFEAVFYEKVWHEILVHPSHWTGTVVAALGCELCCHGLIQLIQNILFMKLM